MEQLIQLSAAQETVDELETTCTNLVKGNETIFAPPPSTYACSWTNTENPDILAYLLSMYFRDLKTNPEKKKRERENLKTLKNLCLIFVNMKKMHLNFLISIS